jgi:hypothetical protein
VAGAGFGLFPKEQPQPIDSHVKASWALQRSCAIIAHQVCRGEIAMDLDELRERACAHQRTPLTEGRVHTPARPGSVATYIIDIRDGVPRNRLDMLARQAAQADGRQIMTRRAAETRPVARAARS